MDSASSVLGGASVLRAADVDVGKARERRRQRRLARLAVLLSVACALAWWRGLSGRPLNPLAGVSLGPDAVFWLPMVLVVLVIAATNRAEALDPALLRPGRFDRRLYCALPNAAARRELVDYFLAHKAHHGELDDDLRRAELAQLTFGYTPVMIEHLLDEALISRR
jgi:SpoVK/Ycf46/Vps4 family AAA+-type ATPase